MKRVQNIKSLIRVYRFFQQNPDGEIKTGIWDDPVWDKEQFLSWFRSCLMSKINRNTGKDWRKLSESYQIALMRDSIIINQSANRSYHRGYNILSTPELKKRYPHIDKNI